MNYPQLLFSAFYATIFLILLTNFYVEDFMTKIKICGLTTNEDVAAVNLLKPDYIGMVLFFPKSKRNLSIERAKELLSLLDPSIQPVAVTVSPTPEQIRQIQELGFAFIQIHGALTEDALDTIKLPILRAFNVSDIDSYERYRDCGKVAGYVFDAAAPGSGRVFDWSLVKKLPRDGKLWLLAGGLNAQNVSEAIRALHPDGVDVSSGVETDGVVGKDADKIRAFVNAVRNTDLQQQIQ